MKHWRIGSLTFGLFLILLGVTLLIGQFDPRLGETLLRNWWPFLLCVLGLELLLANFLANKVGAKLTFDVLSLIFVGIIGLISLGVYSLERVGLWDRLHEVAAGRLVALACECEAEPAGQVDKVMLDAGDVYTVPIRVWDNTNRRVRVRVRGRAYRIGASMTPDDALSALASVEQISRVIYIRLSCPPDATPWHPRLDQFDVLVPSGFKIEIDGRSNIKTREFHGQVTIVEEGP